MTAADVDAEPDDPYIVNHVDRVSIAGISPKTIWESMSRGDVAWSMDFHPILAGMLFELPLFAGDGAWTRAERDDWFRLFAQCLNRVYRIAVPEDVEAEVTTEETPDQTSEEVAGEPAVIVGPAGGATNRFQLTRDVIDLSRTTNDPEAILGYDLSPAASVKNRSFRNWSEADLAQVASVHRNAVLRLERGELPQDWQILRIAAAFRLTEFEKFDEVAEHQKDYPPEGAL